MFLVPFGIALLLTAAPQPSTTPQASASDLLTRASEARRKHDLAAAERLYEQALRRDPTNGPAALGLAETLTDLGQTHAAEDLLVRLIDSLPERPEPRRALALAYVQDGRTAEALEQAKKAVELDPENREGRFCLGSALAAAGRASEAIPEFQKAAGGTPPDVRALHRLALSYASLDDPRAAETFRKVLTLEPNNLGARLNFATYLWQIRDFPHGNEEMERVIQASPPSLQKSLRSRYAQSLVDQARYSQAAQQLEQMRKLGARDYDTTCSLASALGASGRLDEAIHLLREAIALDPEKLLAHHTLGRLLLVQQQPAEAAVEFERCAAMQPGSAGIQLELGRAYEALEKLDKAEAAYREALRLDPTLTKANYSLGTLLARTGRKEEAAAQLAIYQAAFQKEQEATLKSGSQHAEVNLAWEELRRGHAAQALAQFDRHPENADALRGSARALIELGRGAEALQRYERAVALAPDDLSLRYELDKEYDRTRKK